MAQRNGDNTVIDDTNGAAYLYSNKTWVAFENEQTVTQKVNCRFNQL